VRRQLSSRDRAGCVLCSDKLLLEPKADLKARIGFSPDEFDALILSFAHQVTVPDRRPRYRQIAVEYDPFREPNEARVSRCAYDYNPFAGPW
jgi:hypothetical protein